jgi:hypothetical protein
MKFADNLGAELWTYRKKTRGGKNWIGSSQETLVIGAFVPIEEYKNIPNYISTTRQLTEIKETTEVSKFRTSETAKMGRYTPRSDQ